MSYSVPFGDNHLSFDLPWRTVDVARRTEQITPTMHNGLIEARLRAFAGEIVLSSSSTAEIVIVFTDATRASPDRLLAEPLLKVFQQYHLAVTLLCAVGMHRPSTEAEKREKLGDWVVDTFHVLDHDPAVVETVATVAGVPVQINPLLLNKTVISLGVVEPHQYAGYSGGYKTMVIGCGGPRTIAATHGPRFLQMYGTRLANIENNPFQDFVRSAGTHIAGKHYAVNAIVDESGQVVQLAFGTPQSVHDTLVAAGRSYFEILVSDTPYDVVIAGVGAPKDANLYQASRGATYIGLSAAPVIRDNGVIVLPARLEEGAGAGRGEQNMFEVLQRFGPTPELLAYLLENGCQPGEQRAFMIAQLLQRYRLIVVGATHRAVVESVGLQYAATMAEIPDLVGVPNPRVLLVPHAIKMIPVATGST